MHHLENRLAEECLSKTLYPNTKIIVRRKKVEGSLINYTNELEVEISYIDVDPSFFKKPEDEVKKDKSTEIKHRLKKPLENKPTVLSERVRLLKEKEKAEKEKAKKEKDISDTDLIDILGLDDDSLDDRPNNNKIDPIQKSITDTKPERKNIFRKLLNLFIKKKE